MLDFRMQTFLAVCECMNYTKAAVILHITQPAVSQHIKYLENHYGTKLLKHEGKRVTLTPAGELLLQASVAAGNDEKYLISQMHADYGCRSLKLGATMTIGEFVIAKPLANYIRKYPDSDVSVCVDNTDNLLNKLRHGEINLALVEGYFDSSSFDSKLYHTERFIPVCSVLNDHALACSSVKQLIEERLFVREQGSGTREILKKNLEARNISVNDFKYITEVNDMNAIIQLVELNCGITFLYEAAVRDRLSEKKIITPELKDFNVEHDFTFVWNKGSIFQERYKEICDIMSEN